MMGCEAEAMQDGGRQAVRSEKRKPVLLQYKNRFGAVFR